MDNTNPDEELIKALVRYERWVLLKFLKIEFQIEHQKTVYGKIPSKFIPESELLKITCSSMVTSGMSVYLMEKIIIQLLEKKLIRIRDVTISDDTDVEYYLTPKGNLETMQQFGRLLNYNDFVNTTFTKSATNVAFEQLQKAIDTLKKKNFDSIFIKLMIIDEYLVYFPLSEYIKHILDITHP